MEMERGQKNEMNKVREGRCKTREIIRFGCERGLSCQQKLLA
jgi:hypothetical protein